MNPQTDGRFKLELTAAVEAAACRRAIRRACVEFGIFTVVGRLNILPLRPRNWQRFPGGHTEGFSQILRDISVPAPGFEISAAEKRLPRCSNALRSTDDLASIEVRFLIH